MITTVIGYKNTGLTVNNSLDNINKLESLGFQSLSFPDIAILQDRGNVSIRIETDWNTVKDVDYIKINNTAYWCTGISMLNENVAELSLQEDYITTVGINNINVISGQCERRHVSDDIIFKNTIPEPFTPQNTLELDYGTSNIGGDNNSDYYNVILSTVDFNKLDYTAQTYVDSVKNLDVTVPLLPLPNDEYTVYAMRIDDTSTSETIRQCTIGCTSAYEFNADAVQQIRSLGIESGIIASYNIPKSYFNTVLVNGQYKRIIGNYNEYTSTLNPKYSTTIKNNKTFSGQFQSYVIMSPCSGETKEYRVEDIYDENLVNIIWCTTADGRFNGYPMCKPKTYHNQSNKNWLTGIKGVQWQNSPISYAFASGYTELLTTSFKNMIRSTRNELLSVPSKIGSIVLGTQQPKTTMTSAGGGYWNELVTMKIHTTPGSVSPSAMSGVQGLGSSGANIINNAFDTFQDLRQGFFTKPDMDYAVIPNLQDYLGNNFFELRYRLSEADTIRFDHFLTQFGYAVDEELTNNVFIGRTKFNYVKASDVNLKTNRSYYETMGVISQLNKGVRIWHVAPSFEAMLDNPIG